MNSKDSIPNFNYTLSEEEEARWLCLIERVNFLFDKMENLPGEPTLDFSDKKVAKKVHKALVGYINDRFPAMLWDLSYINRKNYDNKN